MADIVLFRPKSDRAVISGSYPLCLIYIATPCVKRGYTVKIIDGEAYPDWRAEVDKAVDDSTICAGVNVMTGGSIRTALEFSQSVKNTKRIPVVWGGTHPSFQPVQTLKHPLVDIVITGEGDRKFLEVVERINSNRDIGDVKEIFYKNEGKEVFSGEGIDFLDLDQLDTPLFDLVDIDYYASHKRPYFKSNQRGIDLNVDRGCPYRCAFCYNTRFNKRRWRTMKPEKVLGTIEELIRKHNINAVTFVSDNFFVDKKRVYEICKGLIDRKMDIEWHTDIRADTFVQYEDDLIELIKQSGCVSLTFGIESGSDRILKMIDKDIKRETVIKAHEKAKKLGLKVNYHFMIGFPEETRKDIAQTMSLMRLLAKSDNASINGPNIYVPYPGTPLYDRCVEMGFTPPNSLKEWENYIWYKNSKLPWFNKSFKGYIEEVRWITSFSINAPYSKNALRRALYNIRRHYCRLRYLGLMHGIRMFNIDIKVIQFLTGLRRDIDYLYKKWLKHDTPKKA